MSAGWIILIVVVVLLIAIALWLVAVYNSLVQLRNRVANGWAQIDVTLKQRADLIPNLVATVKGYAAHESSVFEQVTRARAVAMEAANNPHTTVAQRAAAEDALTNALFNLRAVAEAYPDLKANQNFLQLQGQLSQLEERIAYARQFYNDVVLKYNNAIAVFPSNIVASMFGFHEDGYYQVDQADRVVPTVQF
ncbi:LemA family protein [Bifidobacterium gallicum]|uniref:LemA family protein n=1 Tax=Bifidobacterium gallicum DSM 20093 = LMG 11596 TaxID=561180 RepID=D1NVK7_9BIFI|nr:LemA family protein [Bifidobacterium gallicum]EFA22858.1 LemA family protein [Bifidobacterium gallicum DSM 20093 = LMG 11596]KFI59433.1 membrane protein [Bifidobacterium gallicum DSM 20093 = LMG 11596]